MMRIPYKPLSERMLQEPFWLGLITVFVVLAFIGLVWCAKRHFPEKIEKLLAEEADRNRRTFVHGFSFFIYYSVFFSVPFHDLETYSGSFVIFFFLPLFHCFLFKLKHMDQVYLIIIIIHR